jgi:hypothetical protein
VLAPGTRLRALDTFAAEFPEVAAALVPGYEPGSRLFGRRLFARLDRTLRGGKVDDAVLALAAAFQTALAEEIRQRFTDALAAASIEASERRARFGRVRSIWGVTPAVSLTHGAEADRRLGVEAETVVTTAHGSTRDFDVLLKEQVDGVMAASVPPHQGWAWATLSWALLSFDNFYYLSERGLLASGHYGSGRFGVDPEEMQLLRGARKSLYVIVHDGDGPRDDGTPARGERDSCAEPPRSGSSCPDDDKAGERGHGAIAEYATAILVSGLGHDRLPKARAFPCLALDPARFTPETLARELRQLYLDTNPRTVRSLQLSRGEAARLGARAALLTVVDTAAARCPSWLWVAARDSYYGARRGYFRARDLAGWRPRIFLRRHQVLAYAVGRDALLRAATALGRRATARRLRRGRVRSVWGTTPILTLPILAECDRRLGFESESLVFTTYYISRRFDRNLKPLLDRVMAHAPSLYRPFFDLVFAWALVRYDFFHFFCDRGILPSLGRMGINPHEAALLRETDKRLYTYTYGADVRTRAATLALGTYNFCVDCPEPGRFCICDDDAGAANIAGIAPHANAMLAMGDMLAYVPDARELHFWPLDLDRFEANPPRPRDNRPLRLFHAPNHAHFKGTRHLEAAVERLQAEGHAIEIVRVSGVPNEEVLRQMSTCDIVAEQFIGGFHGYTALEAMACGKPVLCYVRDRRQLAGAEECPLIDADPDSLERVLRDCLFGRYDLAELGRRGRRYVEKHYSIDAVAARLGRLYLATAALPAPVRETVEAATVAIEKRLGAIRVAVPEIANRVA